MNSFSVVSVLFRAKIFLAGALAFLAETCASGAETAQPLAPVELNSLTEFRSPGANWTIAGTLAGNPRFEKDLVLGAGHGLLVNRPTAAAKEHLFTTWEHEDLELELDFLVPSGSNSGVYLQGRYEIQISDTWNKPRRPPHDTGSIYQRWDAERPEGKKGYEGYTPRADVERAPGLWQHLRIIFQAPRFDAHGLKIKPARFIRVELNGLVVHENTDVSGPTRASGFDDESPSGPLMLQGDHGAVAYRNIAYRRIPAGKMPTFPPLANVSAVEPTGKVRIEEGACVTSKAASVKAVAVGSPGAIHYCYAVDGAALLNIWRGPFLVETGEQQKMRDRRSLVPAGAIVILGELPSLAWLEDGAEPWPVAPTKRGAAMQLDKTGFPVFPLSAGPRTGTEEIIARADRQGLTRRIVLDEPIPAKTQPGAVWLMLAEAGAITPTPKGYVIGDHEYYLDLAESTDWEVVVRKAGGRFQLVARAPAKAATFTYDLIW
jgi:hypothetical protein